MNISEETYLISLGVHIRKLREERNISQQGLADSCNLPKIQIGRVERAEINTTVKTLIKIANALEIEPKALFDFKI